MIIPNDIILKRFITDCYGQHVYDQVIKERSRINNALRYLIGMFKNGAEVVHSVHFEQSWEPVENGRLTEVILVVGKSVFMSGDPVYINGEWYPRKYRQGIHL